jgi:hypothetical protein
VISRRLIAINLRLQQRMIVRVKDAEFALGLLEHKKPDHICNRVQKPLKVKVDCFGPQDFDEVEGCPARLYDSALTDAIYRAIEIEDLGGLKCYSSLAIAHLPYRAVWFYKESIAARDRFLREADYKRCNS